MRIAALTGLTAKAVTSPSAIGRTAGPAAPFVSKVTAPGACRIARARPLHPRKTYRGPLALPLHEVR
jgi:hypothetical protein